MTATLHCPDCGSPLPADAPQGECPRCLLKAGFESEPAIPGAIATPSVAATRTSAGHGHFVPPSVAELQQRIPQYEILELIGQGGMGAVYKAKQAGLGRSVAIKILPFEVSQSTAFTERFSREARALALLSHPHIVAVHDFGQADGLCYFVMEYVDGVNLRQALQAGKMNPQQALAIVPQICEALQYAHEEGVVHRDIKPENILIDKRGRVKIADFGLAKLLGADSAAEHSITGTQQVMGTLRYMAPEQMFGSKEVDHRADIFSLGVVFYELLTGELPVGRFAPPSKKSGVDVRLDEVVLRALESEPNERYQSVSEMKHGLDSISKLDLPAALPVRPATAAPTSSGLELLLDETDRKTRILQHGLLLAAAPFVFVAMVALYAGPIYIVPMLAAAAGCLLALAYMYQQHWEANVGGHRVVFANGVFNGSRLYINGDLVSRGGVGFRQDLQGWLPDGSGRRIIAQTDAGLIHFRCRLFLQPAIPGVIHPGKHPIQQRDFAGSTGHFLIGVVLTIVTCGFLLYVGGPFVTMAIGPDLPLIKVGESLLLGDNLNTIVSGLAVMLSALIFATTYTWWTYRAAVSAQNPPTNTAELSGLDPRLSRAAIGGAAISPLFVLGVGLLVVATIPAVTLHRVDGDAPRQASLTWMMIPFAVIELVCLVAPFATTLLGVIAIANIRSSKGKVYGMPLAVFDALLYPLLLLDLILFVVGFLGFSLVASLIVHYLMKSEGAVVVAAWMPVFLTTVVFIVPLIVLLDIWLIRLTWRAATSGLAADADKKKLSELPQKEPPPFQPAARKTTNVTVVILILLAVLAIPLVLVCVGAGSWFLLDVQPRPTPMKEVDSSYELAPLPEQFPDPIRENTEPAKDP